MIFLRLERPVREFLRLNRPRGRTWLVLAVIALALSVECAGATWYVDGFAGDDSSPGTSPDRALRRIQAAADQVRPGDTVIVAPGVYHEHVSLPRGGTKDAPIRFLADRVERYRVVITGADSAIRQGRIHWELVDRELGLYAVPFTYRPTRVLANQVDLLPYPSLADLKEFRFIADDYPGHRHGFAWDADTGRLYVRLRQDGRYGPNDPNCTQMAVSPPTGGGEFGNHYSRPDNYGFGLRFRGPAHVVLDGFTFETPGMTGVYSEADDVVVRNSWFYGCRMGVSGRAFSPDPREATHRVTVEQCYYTQYPAFTDLEDTIRENAREQLAKSDWKAHLMHWQRKAVHQAKSDGVGRAYSYETGLVSAMGRDWVIQRNHVYDVFEGIASGGVYHSVNAHIRDNRFERVCDNAVETEDHARDIHIYRNVVIDAFEAFSWQPQSGAPLPGPVYIYDNLIWQTDAVAALWTTANLNGGAFKLGANDGNWSNGRMAGASADAEAPGGFWAVHNTIVTPRGGAITRVQPRTRRFAGFHFINNLALVQRLFNAPPLRPEDGIRFLHNAAAPVTEASPGFREPALVWAGTGGILWDGTPSVRFPSKADENVNLDFGSLPLDLGLTDRLFGSADATPAPAVPATLPLRRTLGAPALSGKVGPQPR